MSMTTSSKPGHVRHSIRLLGGRSKRGDAKVSDASLGGGRLIHATSRVSNELEREHLRNAASEQIWRELYQIGERPREQSDRPTSRAVSRDNRPRGVDDGVELGM